MSQGVANAEKIHHGPHWNGEHNEEFFKMDKKEIHISSRAMRITWGNDCRFWQWTNLSKDESCFGLGAELIQVNWIEVVSLLDLEKIRLDPMKNYEVIYIVKFKVDAFGWHSCPIIFEVSTPDGKKRRRSEILDYYKKNGHNWQEIYGGEFSLASSNLMGKVEFSMKEVKTDWWKGGIVLEGIKIRPKVA
ncbi:protein PHLOEM PROTEIN 2-LIKE A2 isoform X1 [Dendrobium catenatum]|uniref:Protein PHLOEM PROTEIN 2-LIKE A2 n=1 Tax=Dendrobium catenatum TaxID=906689 RepID=A0A2I0WM95_9ASPA|nr:protein PHLOEM PROTEIN 2-LIKE A2 isoform X1 [Dendrobium catenatum]PKU76789.1 Protein PHLOEM PROTEIN 2-LIKE A2 [Dendrobium catenatum]